MSRCTFCVFCGALFLLSVVNSPVMAAEITRPLEAATPIVVADLQASATEAFESHQIKLGTGSSDTHFDFGQDAPSPLFTSPSLSNAPSDSIVVSEWDYLWRNASRIPITSIPEPTTGSLLIGGAILLCRRQLRKSIK